MKEKEVLSQFRGKLYHYFKRKSPSFVIQRNEVTKNLNT